MAVLAGGGDLSTAPEENQLWHTVESQHDSPGFSDSPIAVADRSRAEIAKWPLNFDWTAEETKGFVEREAQGNLSSLVTGIGYSVLTKSDDIFFVPPHTVRIFQIEQRLLEIINVGDEIRNWSWNDNMVAICIMMTRLHL